MRPSPVVLLAALVLVGVAPRADASESSRFVVARLAAATPAPLARATTPRAGAVRALAPDAALIAAAATRLAALGLRVDRALLDALPAPSAAARPAAATFDAGFDRVVLIAAADSVAADAARAALVSSGLADWAEPLRTRRAAIVSLAALPAAPARAALLDSLPDDPLLRQGLQWGLDHVVGPGGGFGGVSRADVHAPEGWAQSVGSDAVLLACADTGIDPNHPELAGTMFDGSARIVDALNVTGEPVSAVTDSFAHGTLAAGVMAARTNDGVEYMGRGVAGVCGGDGVTTAGCHIVPIKIAPGHSGEATSFDIARAAIYAADVGARAMNLSFGGGGASQLERDALEYALVRGCVVVAAAGNNGGAPNETSPVYPAAYAADGLCIQAGASDTTDARAGFSSFGPGLDLLAPGVSIWTTYMTYPSYYGYSYGGYVAASGTSFAAPFVSGAVGLLAARRPELTDTDFQHVLRVSADDVGAAGVDAQTGWGRLDLGRALAAVHPGIGIWHDEVAADSVVADTTAATLTIGERGPGTLDRFSGSVAATRFAAYATVTLPDSFVDSVRVWPRVGGTFAARGDYQLPYFAPTAQVVAITPRSFTLRGWLYRADGDTCASCPEPWIPLPPEYVRFGFTVLGVVAPSHPHAAPKAGANGLLAAGPNPFRDGIALAPPAAGRVAVLDASGRLVRSFDVGAGAARWDGRDDAGRAAPPGLYFVRWRGGGQQRIARVVRLQP